MNTRRGIIILFGSAAVWGIAALLSRPFLPDAEATFFLFLVGAVSTGIILEGFCRVDERPMTWPQVGLMWTWMGLLSVWLMWTPLPVDEDLPRIMSVLPWRFDGNKVLGGAMAAAFAVWTMLAHRFYEGFERRYWRALGLSFVGLAVVDGFLWGQINPVWPIGLLLAAAGFLGPELLWVLKGLLRRRRRDVFGAARFEDDRQAAQKAGLK